MLYLAYKDNTPLATDSKMKQRLRMGYWASQILSKEGWGFFLFFGFVFSLCFFVVFFFVLHKLLLQKNKDSMCGERKDGG